MHGNFPATENGREILWEEGNVIPEVDQEADDDETVDLTGNGRRRRHRRPASSRRRRVRR